MAPFKLKCHSAKQAPAPHDPNTPLLVNKLLISLQTAANYSRLSLMCFKLVPFIIYVATRCIKS